MALFVKFLLFTLAYLALLPGIRFQVYYVLDNNSTNATIGALLIGVGLALFMTAWEIEID